jgi:heavy metal sensor kinase
MKLKIAIPDTNDEIRQLAETFDGVLARLDKAFNSQRQFVEDLSHELKTPLTIMKGEFEVLLKNGRTAEEYVATLKSGLEEIDKLTALVENLLMIARLESHEIAPEITAVDISALIRKIADDMKVLADQKEIDLRLSVPDGIVLSGDAKGLKRLFANLLDNAIKYTPSRGKISVYASREEPYARITVADTGNGIPPEELSHIFDRFYRVDKSRSSGGFGLGLSIARSIAEMHKGMISVTSHPDQGSVFTVKLPLPA